MPTVYEIVTERILQKLDQGIIPWRKPWRDAEGKPARPVSWVTQKPYRGVNALLLEPGEYATWNQIHAAGGRVKAGAKAHLAVFWKTEEETVEVEDPETGEIKKETKCRFLLRYYNVFEINSQCEGLKSKREAARAEFNPIATCETIKKGYRDAPPITHAPGRACYDPSSDIISLPDPTDFYNPEGYYSVLFHEMIHSTGHESRLARKKSLSEWAAFGSENYGREELIAELGAAMLCAVAGIDNSIVENSAAYIQHWRDAIKADSRLVVMAATASQKAADYILGVTA